MRKIGNLRLPDHWVPEELVKDPRVAQWFQSLRADKSGSVQTEQLYLSKFAAFLDWVQETEGRKSSEALIQERIAETRSGDVDREKNAERRLTRFYSWLTVDAGLESGTASVFHTAVRSFYSHQDIKGAALGVKTPKKRLNLAKIASEQPLPTMAEWKEKHGMLTSLRDRAAFSMFKDTGLAPKDLLEMTYGFIKPHLVKDFVTIKWVRQKTGVVHHVVMGPDTMHDLRMYFESRQKGTRKIPPETLTDDSPLFRAETEMKPLRLPELERTFRETADFNPYMLRKNFKSKLTVGGGVSDDMVEYWMGHKLPQQISSYLEGRPDEQLTAYQAAYRQLSLDQAPATARDVIIATMKAEAKSRYGVDLKIEQRIQELGRAVTPEEEYEWVSLRLKQLATGTNGNNGRPFETKLVNQHNEEEIADLVAQGWDLISNTPVNGNGNLLLRRKLP